MRVLIFGTTYVDSAYKCRVLELWLDVVACRNPSCDALLVDSASLNYPHVPMPVMFCNLGDNIGHLSRSGRDGWGRAFSHGLDYAIDHDYDWVVHIEGDSLCTVDIAEAVSALAACGVCAATIPVSSMPSWPETGLMFFRVKWLRQNRFVERYDWQHRMKYPEPERVVGEIAGHDLKYLRIKGMRDDHKELTTENFGARQLSWLTHASLPVMEAFTVCA